VVPELSEQAAMSVRGLVLASMSEWPDVSVQERKPSSASSVPELEPLAELLPEWALVQVSVPG
jgi:hypothetical protein